MPSRTRKPARKMQSLLSRTVAYLTPSSSSPSLAQASSSSAFSKAPTPTSLFPPVDPSVDGDDCLHDCASCTISYPRKFEIEESDSLYGHVKGWQTHLIVATGKNDWVRDIVEEKGSVMEAVGRYKDKIIGREGELRNGRLMLSASDMPTPDGVVHGGDGGASAGTRVLLMPAWKVVEDVGVDEVASLLDEVVGRGVTNTTPLNTKPMGGDEGRDEEVEVGSGLQTPDGASQSQDDRPLEMMKGHTAATIPAILRTNFSMHTCPHRAVVLMCSQKTRDARCGQSAPLLRKEFERHLRPLGLYRDLHDERPGGVGIYFISHVGGHKYSANIIIYRKAGTIGVNSESRSDQDEEADGGQDQAVQGIWLARVRPDEVENIVRYTVLQGKVVKPERQLRGGFDRQRGLVSW